MSELSSQFPVTFPEAILLISLNDQTGRFESDHLAYAINAAVLTELLRQGRITVECDKVVVKSTTPTGDELLEVAISRLAANRRPGKLTTWIRGLYRDKKLPCEVLTTRLVRRGILTRKDAPLLWVFHRTVYPTRNPAPEQQLRCRIEEAVLSEGNVDATISALVALLHAGRMLPLILGKKQTKKSAAKIRSISASNPLSELVGKALAVAISEDETMATTGVIVAATGNS